MMYTNGRKQLPTNFCVNDKAFLVLLFVSDGGLNASGGLMIHMKNSRVRLEGSNLNTDNHAGGEGKDKQGSEN